MKTIKVLVIEDDAILLSQIVAACDAGGFITQGVFGGKEGLRAALATKPDMIVFDIIMPHVDGLMIIKKVRAAGEWGARVPLIAFTNLSTRENEHMITGRAQGISFFTKAETSLDALVATLHTTYDKIN